MEQGWKQAARRFREHLQVSRCPGANDGLGFLHLISDRVKEGRTAHKGPPPQRLLGAGRWMTARGAGLMDDPRTGPSGFRRVFVADNGAVYEAAAPDG